MFFICANWPLKNFRGFIQVHKTSGCYKGNADMYLETLNSQLEWWKDLIFPSAKTHFSHTSQQDCPRRKASTTAQCPSSFLQEPPATQALVLRCPYAAFNSEEEKTPTQTSQEPTGTFHISSRSPDTHQHPSQLPQCLTHLNETLEKI